ncbi:MAG: ATP-binding cassette domain-containing protein [Chlorobiales bacterium]|nr:ATP-binding cassette domain-containing protein [Chlorobiales bacterium]
MMSRLEFNNVSFFSNGKKLLDDISFGLPDGSLLLIIGTVGAGKILIPKMIAGILSPDEGDILLDGQNLNEGSDEQLRQLRGRISYVFQNGGLISNLSILENLLLPLDYHYPNMSRADKMKRIGEQLDSFQLKDVLDARPAALTRSTCKLIGFVRALLIEPEFVLYDEPLSNCDATAQRTILRKMVELKRSGKVSQVAVSQGTEYMLRLADYILVLDHGRVIEIGTQKEIAESKNEIIKAIMLEYQSYEL